MSVEGDQMDYGMVLHRQLGPESSEPAGDVKYLYQ